MKIPKSEQVMFEEILKKFIELKATHKDKLRSINFNELFSSLSKKERALCERYISKNPLRLGFKGAYIGMSSASKDLIAIKNQHYKTGKKTKKISTQFLPKHVYLSYQKLNRAYFRQSGRKLLIDSAYRSSAYQLFTFFQYLKFYQWDIHKTARRVALPGYSEHGDSKQTAIDFMTMRGVPSNNNPLFFAKTREYHWLLENAYKFGFSLSYPRRNKWGVMFEPWHWRFKIGDVNVRLRNIH